MNKEIKFTVNYGRRKTKDFEFFIVPNKFHHDYAIYAEEYKKSLELIEPYKNAVTEEESAKASKDIRELDYYKVIEHKFALIKTLMIANEYEYDHEFWDTKVNPKEISRLIQACVYPFIDDAVKKNLNRALDLSMKSLLEL